MNLRRAAAAAAILLVALPGVALGDDPGTDGAIVHGSRLVTLVVGQDAPGAISVRFASHPKYALFYENNWVNGSSIFNGVTPTATGNFALHDNGIAFSQWGKQFGQTSAPVTTGAGTVASPWVVTSAFSDSALDVVQKVSHIDGSRALTLSWKVTNTTNAATTFSAFWDTDLYVNGSDKGTGALAGGPPRTLEGIAKNGTTVGLVELTPWSHYFEGGYDPSQKPDWDAAFTYDNHVNPHSIDNGFGVEWDKTLAAYASTTFVLGFNAAEPGTAPAPEVAPDITGRPAAGPSRIATFRFSRHAGDTAIVSYECSMDGGQFVPCASPQTYHGLSLGEHMFRVHGLNANGVISPAASAAWTIAPVRRAAGSHPAVSLPAVAVAHRRLTVGCSLRAGRIARCAVTLVGPGGVVVGHGVRVLHGAHQHRVTSVVVTLTRRGRALASQPGGVRVVAAASVLPVGASKPLGARRTVHVVAPSVDVTPGELQFQSSSAVLLPGGVRYLRRLMPQLAGARTVVATGYTDDRGTPAWNHQLGLDRAQAVCTFVQHHAHVACTARSFGETHPRATNATAAGRARNRRVELKVTY